MQKIFLLLFCVSLGASLHAQENNSSTGEKTVAIPVKGCLIEGTLRSPVTSTKKIAVIIAGSGPTDRNGNNPLGVKAGSYRMIAEELAKQQIASFRYDKRGVGKSTVKNFRESDLVFDDYINDVVAIVGYLGDSLGFPDIYLVGHSEGSLVGMIAAQRKAVKGYQAGEFDEACRDLERLLGEPRLNKDERARVVEYCGYCAVAFNDPGAARDYFRRWLEIKPDVRLDPITTSPKIRDALDEAKADIKRAQAQAAAAAAQKDEND